MPASFTSTDSESEITPGGNLEGYLRSHGRCGDFGRPHVSRIELRRGLFDRYGELRANPAGDEGCRLSSRLLFWRR